MNRMQTAAPDAGKLEALLGRVLTDIGAAMGGSLVLLGDRLGLWRAMAEGGPMESTELARRTGTTERYVREWLAAQAAAGYLDYDPGTRRYSLPPEQTAIFADEESPVFMAGVYDVIASAWRDEPKITDAFRSGHGLGWHERSNCLFCGTERFFRTAYLHNLVQSWLPALDGVMEKLQRGATVADVGCGHGASTILMARSFPNSRFTGFDYHAPSVAAAKETAKRAGLGDTISFEVAAAKEVPARGFDLACMFDCLHDMGDPEGAARHLRSTLAPDGTLMVVEPFARDRVEDNLNPVGRVYYAASTMICTPASLAQEGQAGLGAQAGPKRLLDLLHRAGFGSARVATETPFNIVLEARP